LLVSSGVFANILLTFSISLAARKSSKLEMGSLAASSRVSIKEVPPLPVMVFGSEEYNKSYWVR